ncbi:Adenylate cyclase 1 [Andreprevotia sp. IGB-42]|uniref:CHASE2 domain-containing protein n=1 Tax=Andreprevotia sp. IGB-42 TaxID=2497473 RepID=UPI0013575FEB|nr:adenylate/guanylate cyclase domain-containing protein [Andreprevotia sp. IGB-42]KAF0813970.1 Adenylate cyclase 1 [Andreprevotia sp. IGB-42]
MFRRLSRFLPQLLLSGVCILLLLAHVIGAVQVPVLERLDAYLYDVRLRLAAPHGQDPRVVIVDIDEKSLAALGRWPWRRDKLADLIDTLFDRYQVRAAGFDIVFAEPDDSSGLPVLRRLAAGELKDNAAFRSALDKLGPQLDSDQRFAKALNGRNVVTGFYFGSDATVASSGKLPPPVMDSDEMAPVADGIVTAGYYGANLPQIQAAVRHGGHFVPQIDTDGATRRVSLLARIGNRYYPALSLALARAALGDAPLDPVISSSGGIALEGLQLGDRLLATDQHAQALVPYRGGEHAFPYVSVIDVLQGKVAPDVLRDRIVLVGTTAPGLKDLRVTPVGETYPGVEIHANLIAGILDQNLPQRPDYLLGAEFLLLSLIGPLLVWVLLSFAPLQASLTCLATLLLLAAGDVWLWHGARLDMPFASVLALVCGLYVLNMAYGYFFESRRKRQLTQLFGQYVVPELVEKMSDDPQKYTMTGQSRQLSVLFTDVRSFTKISEGMPADELAHYMNAFLTEISRVIRSQHLGTIDKYMGDCVMAFWGAPVFDPDHAVSAVQAALEIQQAITALNPRLEAQGWPQISVGVGVNTGHMTVGDLGSQFRMTYTVFGDAVNLASRLESLTKHYGVGVLVGEETRDATPGVVYREIDWVKVHGRDEAVAIYEPLSATADPVEEERAARFRDVLRFYRARQWGLAEIQLMGLLDAEPESRLYQVFHARIAAFRQNPPPLDWDGIYVFEGK